MQFSTLASCFRKLEETPSRTLITTTLADFLGKAPAEEIAKIIYLLQGRVAPLFEPVEFGMADKLVMRAISEAYGTSADDVAAVNKKLGDIGSTAESFSRHAESRLTVADVFGRLKDIADASGAGSQERKISILAHILKTCDPLSARYIARIPLDKLRLGCSDMTILDALSWMIGGDKSLRIPLEDAYNLRPDIGYIAEIVRARGIGGLRHIKATVGSPILAQLSQRLPDAGEMVKKMGEVAVEPKYDGVRVQIHFKRGEFVRSFSRNLEQTTDMFPELAQVGGQLHAHEAILDCEAVGVSPDSGAIRSFQETTTRKRKHGIAQASKDLPVRFYVFDILYKDGKDLLSTPLSDRRVILTETVIKGTLLVVSPQIVTRDAGVIRSNHDAQIAQGLEGVMVKKWSAPYEPGRRGFSWVKFKEEEGKDGKLSDTIDAVVLGYYLGEGKRTGFGIGALLVGVRQGDGFVTLTKLGTGVSDALWKSLRRTLSSIAARTAPVSYGNVAKNLVPDVWVHPRIVLEITGDDLTKSPTHGAGYAVRFPRLVRIRKDKGPEQATTVSEIARMYANQAGINS